MGRCTADAVAHVTGVKLGRRSLKFMDYGIMAACSRCGQVVRDSREVVNNVTVLCKPCAEEAYFSNAQEITWPDMNRVPGNNEQQTNSRCHSKIINSGGDKPPVQAPSFVVSCSYRRLARRCTPARHLRE
jgi:hypothetical protein